MSHAFTATTTEQTLAPNQFLDANADRIIIQNQGGVAINLGINKPATSDSLLVAAGATFEFTNYSTKSISLLATSGTVKVVIQTV